MDFGARSYEIMIDHESLAGLGEAVSTVAVGAHAALVSDETVGALYVQEAADSLRRAGFSVTEILVPPGEEHKTLATVERMLDRMLRARLERTATVVALGGGVIGDMAGLAAALLLRGVRYVQVPTTIVAQVDSSVGGKTGVDHPMGKNLIGAFHQPSLVYIDTATLKSLPDRQVRAGMGEVLKHAVIRSPELMELLEDRANAFLSGDAAFEEWVDLIARNCAIKSSVVSEDERESGVRAILNYGHTVAHAVEVLGGYARFLHGEAVSFGMVVEGSLAERRGLWSADSLHRQIALVAELVKGGAAVPEVRDWDASEVWEAMRSDKKVREGAVHFSLPNGLGDAAVVDDVSKQEFADVWGALSR